MKLYMSKQHGAWAMLVVPFVLGMVAGGFDWLQIVLAIGWVPLYLSTYPLVQAIKKKKVKFHMTWFYRYFFTAIVFIIPVVVMRPSIGFVGLLMIPFFLLNIYFGIRNKDRYFWNDISAIIAFSLSSIATYMLGANQINTLAWLIVGVSVLFFVGSTFFVKTVLREKKNQKFRWLSWIYHSLVPLAFLVIGKWLIALAFLPSLIRAIGGPRIPMRPMKMGILEIVNALIFFIVMSIHFYS
ncbi:YwiC-like family protein [Paenisporosarcina antarctica]|uniref:YwiC-like family protein n=1 Tax=Paenisporosarcina antarctica TaxID=417367 RepID=A0A4P7A1D0_9BACL|nr:YwiC-like family protein [Paenisporosarcina antarctica]QBP42607.1 hypothetical protein E2636_16280 [Paenisporosarcina antarctica]